MTLKRTLGLLVFLFLFLTPPALASTSDVCKECHDTSGPKYKLNTHAQLEINCQNCHGSAIQHRDDPTVCDYVDLKDKKSFKEINATCMSCHGKNHRLMFWDGSPHDTSDLACTSCHSIHNEGIERMNYDNCLSCHKDVGRDVKKFSHHPLVEGKMDCASCHNMHGTLSESSIKANTVNELCYKCHTEKRGPFRFAHAPVEESCMNCHVPHGSNAPRLVNKNVRTLCQSCHAFAQHRQLGSVNVAPMATGLVKRGSCVGCHGDIHGSNTDFHFR